MSPNKMALASVVLHDLVLGGGGFLLNVQKMFDRLKNIFFSVFFCVCFGGITGEMRQTK